MAMPQMQSPRPIHRLSYLQRPIWDPASTLLPEAHPDHMDVDRAKSWEDAYDPFAQFHLPGPPANDAFLLLTPVSQSGSFQRLSEPPNPLPSQSLPSSHAESYSSASYPPSETFHLERSASIFSQPGVKMDDSLEWTGNLPSDFRGARTSVDPEIFAMPGAVYDAHRFVQSPTPAETRASSHSAPSLGKQPRRDSVAKQTSPRLSPERPKLVPVKRRRTPRENANWICEICDMPFERSYNLKSHMDTHDPDRPKPFKCEHEGCQREFVRKTDLTRHVQSVRLPS
ncbi:MAG: hypothetical protein M1821_000857 [Bathelium mastoideum]|nr:MAG: hypothetical protein M1821_000857 [Bathelium mastoideum]